MIILEDPNHGKLIIKPFPWQPNGEKLMLMSYEDYAEYIRLGIGVERPDIEEV